MLKLLICAAGLVCAIAPAAAETSRHGLGLSLAPPSVIGAAAQAKPSSRSYQSREIGDVGCASRWQRAYDGYGSYTGDAKVSVCD